MKVKLTLYVEEDAVRRGKGWARQREISLSRVVEEHLVRLDEPKLGESFANRWQGVFRMPEAVDLDPRAAAIRDKHLRKVTKPGP